ncbi:hypothetical protein QQ045_024746 [Rhodiola kirilowii]
MFDWSSLKKMGNDMIDVAKRSCCLGFLDKAERKKEESRNSSCKRKKLEQRVERKMAAMARERAWAQRLAELQKIEEEKKKSMA